MDYNTDDELIKRLRNADPARYNNFQIGEEILTQSTENQNSVKTSRGKKTPAIFAGAGLAMAAVVALTISAIPSSEPEFLISLSRDSAQAGDSRAAATLEDGAADKSLMWYPYYNYTYIPGDTLSKEPGVGNAYKFELTGAAEESLLKLAQIFGIMETNVVQDPYNYDKTNYAIGDYENYQDKLINLTWNGLGSWYYSDPTAYQQAVIDEGCILPGYETEGATTSSEADLDSNEKPTSGIAIPAPRLCEPKPPIGLPTREEAVAIAIEVFSQTGFIVDEKDLIVSIDEWGVYISGNKNVEDTPVSLDYSISWAGPEIAYASGVLAKPVLMGSVPTISEYDAVSRVSDWVWWGAYPMDGTYSIMPIGAVTEPMPKSDIAGSETSIGESDTGGAEAGSIPSEGISEPSDPIAVDPIRPGLDKEPEIKEIEVIFTKATQRLLLIWDSNGTPWLLPGYVFEAETSEYVGGTPVVAVDSKYIDLR
jgi:hypothetical protein